MKIVIVVKENGAEITFTDVEKIVSELVQYKLICPDRTLLVPFDDISYVSITEDDGGGDRARSDL